MAFFRIPSRALLSKPSSFIGRAQGSERFFFGFVIDIAGFSTMTGTQWQLLMAACILTVLPAIIVVAISQRQLVAAIGAGAFGGR